MTAEEKKKRKDRIARAAKPRKQAICTYWLTRSTDDLGEVSPLVDVWLYPPTLRVHGLATWWEVDERIQIRTTAGPSGPHIDSWTLDECIKTVPSKTYPDDGRQCIRVGELPPDVLPALD